MIVKLMNSDFNHNIGMVKLALSQSKGIPVKELSDNILEKVVGWGHFSVLEFAKYFFQIQGVSRACLQELVRHRHASYCVESTRYTLKEKLMKNSLTDLIVLTGDDILDHESVKTLSMLKKLAERGDYPDDLLKYMLPESYKTNLLMEINARSLRNFISLRGSKHAHREIRELSNKMVKEIYHWLPEQKVFFKDITDLQSQRIVGGID